MYGSNSPQLFSAFRGRKDRKPVDVPADYYCTVNYYFYTEYAKDINFCIRFVPYVTTSAMISLKASFMCLYKRTHLK
jgi:hypothetical protein